MGLFDNESFDGHEHVSFFCDSSIGLRAIVAIHRSGPLGAAGGGCRMWPYEDERAALRDALRLSRAMTYKLALVEIPAGGAKAVILGDPARDKSEALLLGVGRAVERLGGRFIISEDVGTNFADLAVIARATSWVSRQQSDTAEATAYGVMVGLRAAVRLRLGRSLDGVTVAVQGLGQVGSRVCRHLAAAGARLIVTDLDLGKRSEVARELGAFAIAPEAIFDCDAQVFAPCALGDVLDARTIARLRCAVVAGSANNPLAHPGIADELAGRGILYAPDIVMSAGGVLGAASGDEQALRARLDALGPLLEGVVARARKDGSSTHTAAEQIARERLLAMGGRP